jgi:hypothetical protein
VLPHDGPDISGRHQFQAGFPSECATHAQPRVARFANRPFRYTRARPTLAASGGDREVRDLPVHVPEGTPDARGLTEQERADAEDVLAGVAG